VERNEVNNEPSAFRILVTSDSKWESDHLRQVTVKSEALRGRGDVTLFVPPQVEGIRDVPIVILLHGVYGSDWNWTRKGGVHRTALRMIEEGTLPPLVIAMPSDGLRGDGTAYLPHRDFDAETWIVDDVPQLVREVVPSVSTNSPKLIGGLSMGGFGAARLGAKYGSRFRGISIHSAVTGIEHFVEFVEEPVAETSLAPNEHDLLTVIEANRRQLPPFRFDCGVDDPLVVHNRRLHQGLDAAEIPHRYLEFPGSHDWAYWEAHVEDTLAFFAELLE